MAMINLSSLALHAKNLMETQEMAESEAIASAIKHAGISEEQATKMNLEAEVVTMMNRDTEAERQEAEAQLAEQASGYKSDILKDDQQTAEEEATLQEETPDAP
jgi:hypothetical protein